MEIYNLVKLSIPKGYATISFDFASAYYKPATLISSRLDKQSKDDLRCLIDDLKNSSSSKIRDDKILLHFKTDACDYGYGIVYKRIHQETTKLIISHLRPSTIKVYLSGWNKWIKCCEKQGIDSEILEKSHLTNFLAEETKDKTASTVNLIKATVLKIFTLVNKPIEQENLLDHIIKDIHNVKKNKLKIEQYEM
uniref:Reverse transcriptase domain-containing protein n=1 Tax=Strongyloides stercoralis TaxID=6248 RepID=A0A0K0EA43_STRER